MRSAAWDRLPAPLRRVLAFTAVALVVYGFLLAAGSLLFPSAAPGGDYALSATVAAGLAGLYLVYLGGFAKLRELVR